jgi:hypothetical protein
MRLQSREVNGKRYELCLYITSGEETYQQLKVVGVSWAVKRKEINS